MSSQIAIPAAPTVPLPNDPSFPRDQVQSQKTERRKSYGPLLEFLKRLCKQVEEQDKSELLNITGQQNRCQAYYDDRQYGQINPRTGEWQADGYDAKEFKPLDNRYKEQVDKLQMEMARAGLDLNVEPTDPTDSAMSEAADFIKYRIEANRKRLFIQHPEFKLAENMALLLKTITYRYTYFDKNGGPSETIPQFNKQSIGEAKSLTICSICGAQRGDDEFCQTCGGSNKREMSTSPVEMDLPSGSEEISSGLVRCIHADPSMVRVSLKARMMSVASSPFLEWIQMVEHGKLEQMFPDAVIPTTDSSNEQNSQTRRDNETAVSNSPYDSTGSASDLSGGEQFKPRRLKLIWLDRWVYNDYIDEHEQKLGSVTLAANTKLGQQFSKGMCIAKIGDSILAAWNEDKNKKWSVCVYGLREHAFHGSGTNALIPVQNTINDLLSYRLANVYFNTNPREFIRQGAIQGDQLPTVDKVAIVTNLDDNQKIVGNAYDRAPGFSLPGEVTELANEQTGALQEQAGTSSLSLSGTSAQSQALGTATGIAAMRDLAVGRMGPNLQLIAAMEVETTFQILECEQSNYSRQQLMALAGLKPGAVGNLGYTARGVDAFINCDPRSSFVITPAAGSWMPTTEQERKADAIAFSEASSKVQDPETVGHLAKVFKQPTQIAGSSGTEREAARRLEEFAKVVQIMVSRGFDEPTDEMAKAVLMSCPNATLSETMDNHPSFIAWMQDWWVSDEARNAPPLLKKVVEVRTIEHKDAITGQMTDANARSLETQAPNQLAQLAMSQMQPEAPDPSGQQGEQQSQQAQVEIGKQAAMNELAVKDREHQLQVDMTNREHDAKVKAS
jgi:hypothetical protein